MIEANVQDFNGNCTIAREKFYNTFSNFDDLQLRSLLRYCFEISSQAN